MTTEGKRADVLTKAIADWKFANEQVVAATQALADHPSQAVAEALWDAWRTAETLRLSVYHNWGPYTLHYEEHHAPA